ncbi:unnamed protein product, partial [Iphiclides podalirius]
MSLENGYNHPTGIFSDDLFSAENADVRGRRATVVGSRGVTSELLRRAVVSLDLAGSRVIRNVYAERERATLIGNHGRRTTGSSEQAHANRRAVRLYRYDPT